MSLYGMHFCCEEHRAAYGGAEVLGSDGRRLDRDLCCYCEESRPSVGMFAIRESAPPALCQRDVDRGGYEQALEAYRARSGGR